MNLFRSAIFALSVVLVFSLGSSSSANTDYPHPDFSVTEDRTLSLRETGSQIVLDTIEDALRAGGVALIGEGFHLDSSLNYVFGEGENNISGEVDAVIPLFRGERQVVFVQPGAIFWTGLADEERTDGNIGLVYRAANLTGDLVSGISVFYDHGLQVGHSRVSGGVDFQSGWFRTALNYYHPLSDTQDGREGYVEDALQGADLRLSIESETARIGGKVGYWKFQEDDDVEDYYKLSFGADVGIRILPGIFVEGGWERHDEEVSLDERWNVGLAFRFALPGFSGTSYGSGGMSTNLYKIVDREKRILYEERKEAPPVILIPRDENDIPLTATSTIAEGDTVTIAGELDALPVATILELVVDEDASSADLGDDFNYGHKVYELDAATGQQSAPSTTTDCPAVTCEMMVPAGVTRFDVEIEILSDSEGKEIPEEVVLQVNVPEEHQSEISGGETTVTIRAQGNTVEFTEAISTLDEDGGTVDVAVEANLASPMPITLDVEATSTDAVEGRDYTISSERLTIPANANGEIASASLRLTGINNDRGEGSKTITLAIPDQALPEGWALGTQTTHTVTLRDDELPQVNLTALQDGPVAEPAAGESETVTIEAEIGQVLEEDVTLHIMIGNASTATLGTDFSYGHKVYALNGQTGGQSAPAGDAIECTTVLCEVVIPAGVTRFDIEANIAMTAEREVREFIDFQVGVAEAYAGLLLGSVAERVAIEAHGNEIGFAANAETTLMEDNVRDGIQVAVNIDDPSPTPITLNVATSGTATVREDYRISGTSLTIPANAASASLTLWGIDNMDGEGSKSIVLTLSGSLPPGWTITDNEHTVTLQDNDLGLSIYFVTGAGKTPSRVEEPASDQSVTVEVGITQAPMAEIKVMLEADTMASTAMQGTGKDYTFTDVELTFPVGSTTPQTATLMVLADTEAEPDDETIVLTLAEVGGSLTAGGNNFSLGGNHTITIPANDNTIIFPSRALTLDEGNNTMTEIPVSVTEPAPVDITLDVVTIRTTEAKVATEGTDYTIDSKSLTIPARQSSGTVTLRGMGDDDKEGDEFIYLEIKVPSGSRLPDGWALGTGNEIVQFVTLRDDDLNISFVTGDGKTPSRVEEPDSGSTSVTVTVGITQAPQANIILEVALGGTATNIGSVPDYSSPGSHPGSVEVMFTPSGGLEKTFTLNINSDNVPEGDETITLKFLDDPSRSRRNEGSGFSFGPKHTITIPANDRHIISYSGTKDIFESGASGTRPTVNIVPPFSKDVRLNVRVTGTAVADDYMNIPSTITIPANTNSAFLDVTPIDDSLDETTETVIIEISEPVVLPEAMAVESVVLAEDRKKYTFNIIDNDIPQKTIGFNAGRSDTTAAEGDRASLFLELAADLPSQVDVTFTIGGVSDTTGYTFYREVSGGPPEINPNGSMFTIPAGATRLFFQLGFPQDTNTSNENITLTLSSSNIPSDWSLGSVNSPTTWMLEIEDDD